MTYGHRMRYVAHMRDEFRGGYDDKIITTELVTVCDIDIATTDGNPMSQVTYGSLVFKGSISPVDISIDFRAGIRANHKV